MIPPHLEVVSLSKSYGTFAALRELSLTVRAGEVLGLVGPNGAGKTTALRALAGIHPPTGGNVRICGHDLETEPVEAKRRLAFMPDEPRLFDYLTVEEHLEFVAGIYGVSDFRARVEPLLAELELIEKRKALPVELSRGMKQKLMIACGFLHDPKVLIFDEPLTGLDPAGIRNMKNAIVRRAKGGAAVILSSHLLHLVEELCQRIVVLANGAVVAAGAIGDLKWQIARGRDDVSLEEAFLQITATDGGSAK